MTLLKFPHWHSPEVERQQEQEVLSCSLMSIWMYPGLWNIAAVTRWVRCLLESVQYFSLLRRQILIKGETQSSIEDIQLRMLWFLKHYYQDRDIVLQSRVLSSSSTFYHWWYSTLTTMLGLTFLGCCLYFWLASHPHKHMLYQNYTIYYSLKDSLFLIISIWIPWHKHNNVDKNKEITWI